jgi:hypothetical protein
MTDVAKLGRKLLGTRLNLRELVSVDNIEEIVKELSVIQCVNCAIWVSESKSPDDELCEFCYDLDTLRF